MAIKLIFPLLLGVFSLVVGTGLLNSAIALIADNNGVSSSLVGAMTSAYFSGYLLGVTYCPRLILRVGYIRFFIFSTATLVTAVLAHGLISSPGIWIILRFVSGIAVLGQYLSIESYLNKVTAKENRGAIFSSYITLTLLGFACSQLLLMLEPIEASRFFLISAIFMVLAIIPFALTRIREPDLLGDVPLQLKHFFKITPLGLIGAIASGAVTASLWGIAPLYLAEIGYNSTRISIILFTIIMGAATLQLLIGKLSDKIDRSICIFTTATLAGLCAMGMAFIGGSSALLLGTIGFMYGGTAFSIYGLCVSHLNDRVTDAEKMAASKAALLMFGFGAALGPLIVGFMMDQMGPIGLPAFFAIILLTTGIYALWRRLRLKPVPENQRSTYYPVLRSSPVSLDLDPRIE